MDSVKARAISVPFEFLYAKVDTDLRWAGNYVVSHNLVTAEDLVFVNGKILIITDSGLADIYTIEEDTDTHCTKLEYLEMVKYNKVDKLIIDLWHKYSLGVPYDIDFDVKNCKVNWVCYDITRTIGRDFPALNITKEDTAGCWVEVSYENADESFGYDRAYFVADSGKQSEDIQSQDYNWTECVINMGDYSMFLLEDECIFVVRDKRLKMYYNITVVLKFDNVSTSYSGVVVEGTDFLVLPEGTLIRLDDPKLVDENIVVTVKLNNINSIKNIEIEVQE